MTYRVIDTSGSELEIAGAPAWIDEIRSGRVIDDCLFWDSREQRWCHVSTLEAYRQAKTHDADGGPERKEVAPEESSVGWSNGSLAGDGLAAAPGEEPSAAGAAPQARARAGLAAALALAALAVVALAIWGDARRFLPDLRPVFGPVPFWLWAVAAGLALLIVAEEFHWVALRMFGVRGSTFRARLGMQGASLLATGLALSAIAATGLSAEWSGRLDRVLGLWREPWSPTTVMDALAPGSAIANVRLPLGQIALLAGASYAAIIFAVTALVLRPTSALRGGLASLTVALMLFGTLAMAFAPLLSGNPARLGRPPPAQTSPR